VSALATPVIIAIFIVAGLLIWWAGGILAATTDAIDAHFGWGEGMGGAVFLAIATNLPEVAIIVGGVYSHNLALAVGNILGGIAIQTVVLAILDAFGMGKKAPLTSRAASLDLVLEAVLVVGVLAVVVMGHQLPDSLVWHGITPDGVLICGTWIIGIYLIGKARGALPWQGHGDAPGGQRHRTERQKRARAEAKKSSTAWAAFLFVIAAVATLIAGVVLQQTSETMAKAFGISGVVFGATILAAVTSLPELSTGLAAVKLGDHKLAISDIFGGNAFLPVIFLVATLVSGKSVLPHAAKSDMYLTALGMLLTAVYIFGLIFRPRRQIARMGIDSVIVLVLYAIGVAGLFAIG
jgi:cation:H+ antiporter